MAFRPWSALVALQSLLSIAAEGDVCPSQARPVEHVRTAYRKAAASGAGHLPSISKNLIQVRSVTADVDTAAAHADTWPNLEGCEMRLVGNQTKKVLPDFAMSASSSNPRDESDTGPAVEWGPDHSRMDCFKSCWLSQDNDLDQWIQWDFGYAKDIRRVWTRGRHFPGQLGDENWVKAFTLEYKDNRTSDKWKKIHGTFNANTDRDSVAENILNPPVAATSLKLRPTEWNGRIALRAEVIGCNLEIPTTAPTPVPFDVFETPLIGEDDIPDYGITASSMYSSFFSAKKSRMSSATCWIPKVSPNTTEDSSAAWIQWDLGVPRIVTRLQTKGCSPRNDSTVLANYSTAVAPYYLLYKDCRKSDEWIAIQEKFKGHDSADMAEHIFRPPLIATHIKLWYLAEEMLGLRVELIGHAMPLPVKPTETVSAVCNNCLCEPVEDLKDVQKAVADKCTSCAYGIRGDFPCNVTGICRCQAPRRVVVPKSEPYVPIVPKKKPMTKVKEIPVTYPVPVREDGKPFKVPKAPYKIPAAVKEEIKKNFKPLTKNEKAPKVKIVPTTESTKGDYVPVTPGESVPLKEGTVVAGCRAAAGSSDVLNDDDCATCALPDWAESWPCNEPTLCDCDK